MFICYLDCNPLRPLGSLGYMIQITSILMETKKPKSHNIRNMEFGCSLYLDVVIGSSLVMMMYVNATRTTMLNYESRIL